MSGQRRSGLPKTGEPRRNLFDHLRLVAALAVLITHEFDIRNEPATWWHIGLWGAWGVNIFFAISGYLNTISLLSSRWATIFLISRAARIYPALIGCIAMTVMVGALLTSRTWGDYWSAQTFEYLWRNCGVFFGQRQYLPGVFENNPITGTNGSLWTLPIEGRYYIYLAIALPLLQFNRWAILAVFAVAFVYLVIAGPRVTIEDVPWRLGMIFAAGSAMAACQGLWGLPTCVLTFSSMALLLGAVGQLDAGILLGTAVVSILVGQCRIDERFMLPLDISYGFYLYAFPVQQIAVALKLPFLASCLFAIVITAAAATLSAVLIERPAIRAAARLKQSIASPDRRRVLHMFPPIKPFDKKSAGG